LGDVNVGTTSSLSSISGGNYLLKITDQNNCQDSKEIEVREAPAKGWSRDGNSGTDPAIEFIGTIDQKSLVFKTQDEERIRITENGGINLNSFIGTGNRYLQVNSAGDLSTSTPSVPWETRGNDNIDDQTDFIGTINTEDFVFRTSDIPRVYIKSTGLIGIGVENPVREFEVDGTVRFGDMDISKFIDAGHDGVDGFIESYGIPNGGLKINFNSGENVKILTNSIGGFLEVGHNTYLSTIDGGVGIGTTTVPSGYKLIVEGKIGVREVYVRNVGQPWPDYVFFKDHKRMSIAEIKYFVENNCHLPGVPDSQNIEQTGQAIGEIQRIQMEKIEELYLYIFELNEKLENLTKILEQKEQTNSQ